MDRLSRQERIASAQVGGKARRFADGKASEQEMLDEIRDVLAGLDPSRVGEVLADAASVLVKTGYEYDRDRLAAELLRAAGADLDAARRVWLDRFPAGRPSPTHRI